MAKRQDVFKISITSLEMTSSFCLFWQHVWGTYAKEYILSYLNREL